MQSTNKKAKQISEKSSNQHFFRDARDTCSKQVSFSRSVQDMKRLDIFHGMPSMCDFQNTLPSLVPTQHLPRPLMKLMTLALLQHTAVPSIVGKEVMVSRVVLNQDKCLLVKSTNIHVLCVSWSVLLGIVSMVHRANGGCVLKSGSCVWYGRPRNL